MRRIVLAVGIAAVVVASAALVIGRSGALGLGPATAPAVADRAPATRLVAVVRTTLVATQPVLGRVGASQTWTIGEPTGTTSHEVARARDAVVAAGDRLDLGRRALADAHRSRSLVLAEDRTVAAGSHGIARLQADRVAQLDRLAQDHAVAQAAIDAATATRDLAAAARDLSAKSENESRSPGTVTAVGSAGDIVERGQSLFAVDGRPTVLLIGTTPLYQALREGMTGPDIAELQANLVALGFGATDGIGKAGVFDVVTTDAVRRWQAALGLEPTGVVRLGDAVVLPTSVRIAAAYLVLGAAATAGAPLMDVASTDEVVTLRLDPALGPSLHPGDPIRFEAADGSTVSGTIRSVGAPAVPTATDQGGPQGSGPAGGPVTPVVAVADDLRTLAGLDGASLRAEITTGTAHDVLAVPVNALVVLADGGFGVEIASGGSTHYVRVQPGIYDRTMVEIRGDGINVGDQVVVPAS